MREIELKQGKSILGCIVAALFLVAIPAIFIYLIVDIIYQLPDENNVKPWFFIIGFILSVIAAIVLYLLYSNPVALKVSDEGIYIIKDDVFIRKEDIQYIRNTYITTYLIGDNNQVIYEMPINNNRLLVNTLRDLNYPVTKRDPYRRKYVKWHRDHPALSDYENGQIIRIINDFKMEREIEGKEKIKFLREKGVHVKKRWNGYYFYK